MESRIDQLERLAELHRAGSLSDAEFDAEKKKLFGVPVFGGPNAAAPELTGSGDLPAKVADSQAWRKRFAFFDEYGSWYVSPGSKAVRLLSFRDRMTICCNIWACLFGPFYFLWLGMWRRAIGVTAAIIVINLALQQLLGERLAGSLGYGFAGCYAVTANWWFYILARQGRDEWNPLKDLWSGATGPALTDKSSPP